MVRRHEAHAAFSGAHVFPGGRVDNSDREAADARWCEGIEHAQLQLSDLAPDEAVAYHVAAARELFEEAGVLLAYGGTGRFVSLAGADDHERFNRYRGDVHAGRRRLRDIIDAEGLRLALDALQLYAHWVTPPVDGRRFDTRFFVTRIPPDQPPAHDEAETTQGTWITAADAIEAAVHHEIVLPPPTWMTLREIERFRSVDEVLAWTRAQYIQRREPTVLQRNGNRLLVMPDATRFAWVNGAWRPLEGVEQ